MTSPSSLIFPPSRLRTSLRLAAFVLPAFALAFACGSDEVPPTDSVVEGRDAAPDTSTPVVVADASMDAPADRRDASMTPTGTTTLTLVNAITDLGPASPLTTANGGTVQLCFGITNALYPGRPLPDTRVGNVASVPGVPIGLAGSVSPVDNLEPYRLTPYLLNAERFAARNAASDAGASASCDAILRNRNDGGDAGALVENVDYWRFQDLLTGILPANSSVLAVVTGCAGDSSLTTAECGSGFASGPPGPGTLTLRIFTLATTTSTGKIGAQIIHAAPSLAAEVVQPVFLTNGIIGDTALPIATSPLPYPQVSIAAPVFASLDPLASRLAYRGISDAGDSGANALPITLANIATLSNLGAFTPGATYTFVILGNKNATMGPLATRGLHYVAVSNGR